MDLRNENLPAVKDLIYRIADDHLILGHRSSEWTGLGPILEEDIAFSSMAQDKLGQALALYQLLHKLGEKDPDTTAFTRKENEFKCCQLTEYPIGEYDFSLMRHFLFDEAAILRFEMLANSSFKELSDIAKKFRGEVKYHVMHAETWIQQLGNGNQESNIRMQKMFDMVYPMALGMFEPSEFENILIENKIFKGENELEQRWREKIGQITGISNIKINDPNPADKHYGGRKGIHTEYLSPLLEEMTEVFIIDPGAEW